MVVRLPLAPTDAASGRRPRGMTVLVLVFGFRRALGDDHGEPRPPGGRPWSERRSAADLMKPPSGHLLKGSHLPEEFLSRLSRAAEQYGARGGI